MATKADRKKWDSLHVAQVKAQAAESEYNLALARKYHASYQDSWLTNAQKDKKDRLREKRREIESKIIDLLVEISPRGNRWLSGAPAHWLATELTWEDAIRPANESLSVVVPGSYGSPDGTVRETRGRVMAPRTVQEGIDFNDEDAVLAEMSDALDIPVDELEIEENDGLSGFGAGMVYTVSISGGSKEWSVVEDYDQQRELALAVVKQDLEEDPSTFNQDFIEQHINMDRLKRDLESDVRNGNEEQLSEMSDREFWRTAERYIDVPEEDEDGDMPDPDDYIEDVADKMTEEQLKDPMRYLEDIYGDDAVKQAIEIAGIDVDAAAEDAVDTDGEAHFLARYDSNDYHTKSGLVYWRDN